MKVISVFLVESCKFLSGCLYVINNFKGIQDHVKDYIISWKIFICLLKKIFKYKNIWIFSYTKCL